MLVMSLALVCSTLSVMVSLLSIPETTTWQPIDTWVLLGSTNWGLMSSSQRQPTPRQSETQKGQGKESFWGRFIKHLIRVAKCWFLSSHWVELKNFASCLKLIGIELVCSIRFTFQVGWLKKQISTINFLSIGQMKKSRRLLSSAICLISLTWDHMTQLCSNQISLWYSSPLQVCCTGAYHCKHSKSGQETKRTLWLFQVTVCLAPSATKFYLEKRR